MCSRVTKAPSSAGYLPHGELRWESQIGAVVCPFGSWCIPDLFRFTSGFPSYHSRPRKQLCADFSISSFAANVRIPLIIPLFSRLLMVLLVWWGALIFTDNVTLRKLCHGCVPQFSLFKNESDKIYFIKFLLGLSECTQCLAQSNHLLNINVYVAIK